MTLTPNYPPALFQYSHADRLRIQAATNTPALPWETTWRPPPQAPAQPVWLAAPGRPNPTPVRPAEAKAQAALAESVGNAIVKLVRALSSKPRRPPPPRREPTYWEQVLGTGPAGRDDD